MPTQIQKMYVGLILLSPNRATRWHHCFALFRVMSATEIFYIFLGNSKTHPLFSQQKRMKKIVKMPTDVWQTKDIKTFWQKKKKEYKNNKTSYVHVCTARDTAAETLCMYGRNGNISFKNSSTYLVFALVVFFSLNSWLYFMLKCWQVIINQN